jgi:uncharacterized protein (TIGR02757 family)
MNEASLGPFLIEKANLYAKHSFVNDDPVQVPHQFTKDKDIEISALISATLSWGNRKTIISKSQELMDRMDREPYEFVMEATEKDLRVLDGFVHRTFQDGDIKGLVVALKKLYASHLSIGEFFKQQLSTVDQNLGPAFAGFKRFLLTNGLPPRASKHFGDPTTGSACKRMVMYSRWMSRTSKEGIDFGLWDINPSLLSIPLDVHSGRVARSLGLLSRKQNDWKAVLELDKAIREILPEDPAKLDYALFGLGVYEDWK